MKKLLLTLLLAGCGGGPVCDDADYETSWGVCVIQSESGSYSKEQVDLFLDRFVQLFEQFDGILEAYQIRSFFNSRPVVIEFTDEYVPKIDGYTEVFDDTPFNPGNIHILVETYGGGLCDTVLSHELLHVLQVAADYQSGHDDPLNWFHSGQYGMSLDLTIYSEMLGTCYPR